MAGDLLRSLHVCQLLCVLKCVSGAALLGLQKPLGRGRTQLTRRQWVRVGQLGVLQALVEVLWFYGLTLCGPLRSVLVFESSATVVAGTLATLAAGCRAQPAKVRGSVFMCLGFLAMLLLDRDATIQYDHDGTHSHQSGLNHLFYHIVDWFGVADHKGGVFLLALASVLNLVYQTTERKMAVEMEGGKRTHALASLVAAVALVPLAALATALPAAPEQSQGLLHILLYSFLCAALIYVVDFYVESLASHHLAASTLARFCPILSFFVAFLVSYAWFAPLRSASAHDYLHGHGMEGVQHGLSGGVFLSFLFFSLGLSLSF